MKFDNYEFCTTGFTSQSTCLVHEVDYQWNGISEGFHAIEFTTLRPDGRRTDVRLLGIVFDRSKHIAVVNPLDLGDHWRGDNFEAGLREVVAVWSERRSSELGFKR